MGLTPADSTRPRYKAAAVCNFLFRLAQAVWVMALLMG